MRKTNMILIMIIMTLIVVLVAGAVTTSQDYSDRMPRFILFSGETWTGTTNVGQNKNYILRMDTLNSNTDYLDINNSKWRKISD